MAASNSMAAPNADEFDLCDLEELKRAGVIAFPFSHPTFGMHDIGLFWDGQEVYALENSCPHMFGFLTEGVVEPGQVICPLHGAVFSLATGECLDRYTIDTTVYPIEVRDGRVWVHAPGERRLSR